MAPAPQGPADVLVVVEVVSMTTLQSGARSASSATAWTGRGVAPPAIRRVPAAAPGTDAVNTCSL